MITQKYRIRCRRWDDRGEARIYSEPSFQGENVPSCDEKAKSHFNDVAAESANSSLHMTLRRIDVSLTSGKERTIFLTEVREPSGDDALDLVG